GDVGGGRDVAGDEYAEGRALIEPGFGVDEAAGLLDEAVDGGKTEPGALADVLGGVERIEDLIDHLGRDSGAGIGDLDQHVFADRHAFVLQAPALLGADVAGADGQHAAVGHGVAGIDREI